MESARGTERGIESQSSRSNEIVAPTNPIFPATRGFLQDYPRFPEEMVSTLDKIVRGFPSSHTDLGAELRRTVSSTDNTINNFKRRMKFEEDDSTFVRELAGALNKLVAFIDGDINCQNLRKLFNEDNTGLIEPLVRIIYSNKASFDDAFGGTS